MFEFDHIDEAKRKQNAARNAEQLRQGSRSAGHVKVKSVVYVLSERGAPQRAGSPANSSNVLSVS